MSSVSHDDAAAAVVASLGAAGGTYNVADDEPLTRRDFYNSLADVLGVRAPRFPPSWLRYLLGSLGETLSRSQRISNSRLRTVGWAPKYRSVRAAWPTLVSEIEANQ
jgi:nucleoside-diphosphate-sugar epimerase